MNRSLTVTLLVVVVALGLAPVGVVVVLAAHQPLTSWVHAFGSVEALVALRGTLVTSLGASLLAFAVGLPAALLIGRTDLRGAAIARVVFTMPSALPPFILGMGWLALANPRAGLLNLLLASRPFDIYGAGGISWVLGIAAIPLVFLPTLASLSRVDSALEEAARLSGATPFRALVNVSLPLVLPAAASGAALAFLFASSAFGVPYMLGVTATPPTPTITTRLYSQLLMGAEGLDKACVLSVELLVLALTVLVLSRRLAQAGGVRLSAGKGLNTRRMPLGRWRTPLSVVVLLVASVLIVLPLAAVALTSVQPVWGEFSGLSMRHWQAVLSSPRTLQAAQHSVALSAVSAALVTALGLLVASRRKRWLALLSEWPYGLPGTVLALAMVVTFSQGWRLVIAERFALVLTLGNTLALLSLAYVMKHLAFGVRHASDGLAQADESLAEAARVSGARPLRAFVDTIVPQLRRPLQAAFAVTFLTCMTELTMSVLLVPTGADVLGTLLFDLQSYADPGAAAVVACAFVALVLVTQVLREGWSRSQPERSAR